jgi:hypothetical protein
MEYGIIRVHLYYDKETPFIFSFRSCLKRKGQGYFFSSGKNKTWGGCKIMDKNLEKKLDQLALYLEKMKLAQYVDLLHNTKRLIWVNLIAGVARGFGIAIGFTILGALAFLILQRLVGLNLPLIGDFIAELLNYVQESKGLRP